MIAQLRLLDQIERSSSPIVTRLTRVINVAARESLRSGLRFQVNLDEFSEPLTQLMMRAVVSRSLQLKRDKWRSRQSLALSFESETRRLARNLDLDFPRIQDQFFRWVRGRNQATARSLEELVNATLQEVTAAQQSTRSAITDFNRRMANAGWAAHSPSRVEALVRTHAQVAFNAAQYKADSNSELVWGYKYVTVGDNRVRPAHAALDGLTRRKNDPIWQTVWPPNGWNCRCAILTLLDPEEEDNIPDVVALADVDDSFAFNPGTLL